MLVNTSWVNCVESPGSCASRDFVRESVLYQPFQHAVNSDPVYPPRSFQPILDLSVGKTGAFTQQ